jgi:hypothetical protein
MYGLKIKAIPKITKTSAKDFFEYFAINLEKFIMKMPEMPR